MKLVDSYGIPQYELPKLDSVGPNMNLSGAVIMIQTVLLGFAATLNIKPA